MNAVLEEKLKELIEEAKRQGAPAMFAVLHLLHGSYHNGEQNKFAQHCCRYSPIKIVEIKTDKVDDIDDLRSDSGNYYH
jgi:hypothetical protein